MFTGIFTGAFTAMITPFRDGRVDESALRRQIDYQIAGGIDGLVAVGTTGEAPTLSLRERERVIALTIEHTDGRVPVIAGVGANCTADAVAMHEFAFRAGAAAGLSVNPYYNKPSQEGLYRHFMALAEVELPIVLYNVPARTSCTMSAQTVARLREANSRRFVAIKEATSSLDLASEITSLCDIPVLCGDDSLTLPLMSLGARGVVSVISNLLPNQIATLARHALAGDFAEARALHHRLFPLTKALFADGNPGGIKHAMKVAELDTGELRLPLCEISTTAASAIESLMAPFEISPQAVHLKASA